MSLSHFYNIWEKHFSHVVIPKAIQLLFLGNFMRGVRFILLIMKFWDCKCHVPGHKRLYVIHLKIRVESKAFQKYRKTISVHDLELCNTIQYNTIQYNTIPISLLIPKKKKIWMLEPNLPCFGKVTRNFELFLWVKATLFRWIIRSYCYSFCSFGWF